MVGDSWECWWWSWWACIVWDAVAVNIYIYNKLNGLRLCDLDLWTHDLGKLTISWPDCRKYLCKFSFKSLYWFKSYRVHKISMAVTAPVCLTLTFEHMTLTMLSVSYVVLVMSTFDEFRVQNTSMHSGDMKVQNPTNRQTDRQWDRHTHAQTHITTYNHARTTSVLYASGCPLAGEGIKMINKRNILSKPDKAVGETQKPAILPPPNRLDKPAVSTCSWRWWLFIIIFKVTISLTLLRLQL